jgi:hypothetical protein
VTFDWGSRLSVMLGFMMERHEAGKLDDEDEAVCSVLIALHRAVNGEIDLTDLAITVIDFDQHSTSEDYNPCPTSSN